MLSHFPNQGNIQNGFNKVETAKLEMRGLQNLVSSYSGRKPLASLSFLGCVTVTPQTSVYMMTLRALGSENLAWCSDNPYASDPDVIVYLRELGFDIYAAPNMPMSTYYDCMNKAIKKIDRAFPCHINDDGCDVTRYIVNNHPDFLAHVKAVTEQTTCGITALKQLYTKKYLKCPAIDVNTTFLKTFDNYYGIQQSLILSLSRIGISLPAMKVAIIGYGPVGSGAAMALHHMGAAVSIVESDILFLAKANWDGYTVITIEEALQSCDLILTATGCITTISGKNIERYAKNGIILGNIGHGREEYDIAWLESNASKSFINQFRTCFRLKDRREVHSLCDGALVNFIAGYGNSSKVMDLTFTLNALAHINLVETNYAYPVGISQVNRVLQKECATLSFPSLAEKLYSLSENQKEYLGA